MQAKWTRFAFLLVSVQLLAGCRLYGILKSDCEFEVEQHLKTPATAAFSEWKVDKASGRVSEMRGRVDSQNLYGATLTSYFVCDFSIGDVWRVAIRKEPFLDAHARKERGQTIYGWKMVSR